MVERKTRKRKEKLPILITEKEKTQILLGLDWLDKPEIGHQTKKNINIIRNKIAEERRERNMNEYEDLFKNHLR